MKTLQDTLDAGDVKMLQNAFSRTAEEREALKVKLEEAIPGTMLVGKVMGKVAARLIKEEMITPLVGLSIMKAFADEWIEANKK